LINKVFTIRVQIVVGLFDLDWWIRCWSKKK